MPANATYLDLMDEAQNFIDHQQYSSAIDIYEKALQLEPNDKILLYNLGWTYNMTGDPIKAKDYYQKAITEDSTYSDAYNGLANIYNDQKDLDNAILNYELAIKNNPKHKYALYNLGLAFEAKGDPQKAIDCYKKRIAADPSDLADIYNRIGNIYSDDLKNYDEAIVQYGLALKSDPNYLYPVYNLGRVYEFKKDYDNAILYYTKALDAGFQPAETLNSLGNIYFAKKDYDTALKYYDLSLQKDSSYRFALTNSAKAQVQKGNHEQAIKLYQQAIVADKNYQAEGWYEIANIYFEQKNWENALKYYTKVAGTTFKQIETQNFIGSIYYAKEDYDSALKHYELALLKNPNYRFALENSGRAWLYKGDAKKAIDFHQRAIAADKNYEGEGYNEIANIYYDKKDWENAVQYYEKAINVEFQLPQTYNGLGNVYFAKTEYETALKFYTLSLQKDPNYRYALINSGKTSVKIGEDENAIKFFQQAITADKDYEAEGYNEIANIYYDRRDYDDAIQNYEMSLKKRPNDKYTLHNLGLALQMKQEYAKAIDQFKKVITQDSNYGYGYLGVACNEYALGNIPAAIEYFQKAIVADKSIPETHYQLANLYLDQLNYFSAREYFEKTLQVDPDYVYAQHNKAWIYEKLGQFKTSKEEWAKAKNLYAKVLANKSPAKKDSETAAKFFYYAQIVNSYFDDTDPDYDPDKIRSNFERAIAADDKVPYYRCMLVKFYNQQKMELESKKQKISSLDRLAETNSLQRKIDEYYMQSLYQYREGVRLLKQKLETKKDKFDLNDLGEFYLAMDEYEEAANVYEEAIKLDDKLGRSYVGFGVAQSKLNNYTEAIKHFKKALTIDPDDLNVQSNLADAYLKSEKLSQAEECYKSILNVAPCHVDALIGLAEHHKLLADQMSEDKKYSDAEELLKQASKLYNDLLDKTKDFKSVSRKLNSQEISSINYSVGYIKVKLYEIDEGLGFRALTRFGKSSDLQNALKSFKKITQEQPDFYKAQTAIKKINKQFSLTVSVRRKIAPSMVFLISLLICLAAQFFFWIGRPISKDRFGVNRASLSGFISQNKLDFFTGGLDQIANKKFNSIKELQEDVRKTISGNDSIMQKLEQLPTVPISEVDYEPIDSTIYISLTFGTLIFMVIGLYLGNISKLKVGAIELEKTTSDTISTSPNFGINR
jgi:superkiller protein 3